jgi:hypothetical protein
VPIPCVTAPLNATLTAPGGAINSTDLGNARNFAQIPGGGCRMRSVVTGQPFWKTEAFWTMTIPVVVPFGWLVPLIRLAYRALR